MKKTRYISSCLLFTGAILGCDGNKETPAAESAAVNLEKFELYQLEIESIASTGMKTTLDQFKKQSSASIAGDQGVKVEYTIKDVDDEDAFSEDVSEEKGEIVVKDVKNNKDVTISVECVEGNGSVWKKGYKPKLKYEDGKVIIKIDKQKEKRIDVTDPFKLPASPLVGGGNKPDTLTKQTAKVARKLSEYVALNLANTLNVMVAGLNANSGVNYKTAVENTLTELNKIKDKVSAGDTVARFELKIESEAGGGRIVTKYFYLTVPAKSSIVSASIVSGNTMAADWIKVP